VTVLKKIAASVRTVSSSFGEDIERPEVILTSPIVRWLGNVTSCSVSSMAVHAPRLCKIEPKNLRKQSDNSVGGPGCSASRSRESMGGPEERIPKSIKNRSPTGAESAEVGWRGCLKGRTWRSHRPLCRTATASIYTMRFRSPNQCVRFGTEETTRRWADNFWIRARRFSNRLDSSESCGV